MTLTWKHLRLHGMQIYTNVKKKLALTACKTKAAG
jgi:hypothetical protein